MPYKVLIVDDEIETCRMLALGLKVVGFETDFALSGTQALAKIPSIQPDAIILDLMMPDTDGFEITRLLRENPDTAKLPIIVLSATAQPDAEARSLALGASTYLRKPIAVRDLAAIIRQHLP